MATKTIGLTGRDYSTVAAWASYVNALTLTGPEVGEVYNDGGPVLDTSGVTINGYSGGSSTNTVTLRPATGQGFRDNANVLTNALRYNTSNGAAIRSSAVAATGYTLGAFFILDGLMVTNTSGGNYTIAAGTGSTIRNCIVQNLDTSGNAVINATGNNVTIENTIIHSKGGGTGLGASGDALVVSNCLVVATGTTAGAGVRRIYGSATAPLFKNTAVFGFTTDFQVTGNANCAANATDKSSFGGTNWGNNGGQTNITSAEWVSTTPNSEDFRLASGSTKLKDNGVSSGVPAVDIIGTSRPLGAAYDIGPWELAAGGAALVASLSGSSSVTSALSTSIVLQAGLSVSSSVTALLSDLGLNSQMISQSSFSGNLSTSIQLASGLIATSTVAADLTTSSLIGFDTPPLKNNTGQVLANETSVAVNVYNVSTGALVVRKTGLTSNASGIVSVKDVALSAGISYAYEVVLQTNGRRLPTATAA